VSADHKKTRKEHKRRTLWQSAGIPIGIAHKCSQLFRGNDFDRIPPPEQMPSHLKPARRFEPHLESTIWQLKACLRWMKSPLGGPLCSALREAPDNFSELSFVLVCSKSTGCVALQVKPIISRKPSIRDVQIAHAVEPEMTQRSFLAALACNQIPARSCQNPIGLHFARLTVIAELDAEWSAHRFRDRVNKRGIHLHNWPWTGGYAVCLEQSVRIGFRCTSC